MQRLRSLLSILMFSVPLLALSPGSGAARDTQTEALSQTQISQYSAKLAHARDIQAGMVARVQCIETRDTELTARSNALEEELGGHRSRERELSAEVEQRRAEYESFRVNYEAEWARFERLAREYDYYRAQKAGQEAAVRKCKRDAWIFGFLCDAAKELATLTGMMESVEGKLATSRRLKGLNRNMFLCHVGNAVAIGLAHFKSGQTNLTRSQLENAAEFLQGFTNGTGLWAITGDMNWDYRRAGDLAMPGGSHADTCWSDQTQKSGGILDWCAAGQGVQIAPVDGPSFFHPSMQDMTGPDHRPVVFTATY